MKPLPAAMLSGRTLPDPCHAYVCVSSTFFLVRFFSNDLRSASNMASCRRFWMRRTCTMQCVSRDSRAPLPSARLLSKNALAARA